MNIQHRHIFFIAFFGFSITFAKTFYVNSTAGSDVNSGTEEAPFATIQKAADMMQAGDNCVIRKGTYRENVRAKASGVAGQPIQFAAAPGEPVYLTGIDLVPQNGWQPHIGAIYKADVSSLGHVVQVFVEEQPMEIARFPNNTGENLLSPMWGEAAFAVAQQQPAASEIVDPALGLAGVDFTGGDLWLLTGLKWVAFSSRVKSHTGNSISFVFPGEADSYAYEPKAGSNYFITGLLHCLDTEKEWHYDRASRMLYFYAPGGVDPSQLDVHVRTRQWGFDGAGRDYIKIKNINFFAAAVNFSNSENCLVDGSHIFYPVPFYQADAWSTTETPQNATYAAIKLGGQNNTMQNCQVAYSWGEGIVVFGKNNHVTNCLVHDINWLCTDAAPIHTGGSGHIIKHNTIYRAGRSGIVHRKSQALEIAYNDIYDCGLLTTDLGATYCWQTDGGGTIIHHNWVHDIVTPAHTAGIYLDNGSSNFVVHHNVVWNTDDLAIQTNLDARNHEIYNNTLWNCSQAMGGSGGNNIMENQIVYNNLSNTTPWFGTDVQQNLTHSDPKFVDAENGDFRLLADSPARDDYIVTAQFLNGGFESGTAGWTGAGCDLVSVTDPVHSGNLAAYAHNRNFYWEGARQSITDVLKDHGPGRYTIEAWVKLASGSTSAYLRFKLVDDNGDQYPGIKRKCSPDAWTKISYVANLTWAGSLREAVFELMTTGGDELTPFYVDDCALITPESSDTTTLRGGIPVAGITDDVTDSKIDAGAYEYGGSHADWRAGSSLSPLQPELPVFAHIKMNQPINFQLAQNYPNPFNNNTTLLCDIPQHGHVQLVIYNALGEKVKTIIDAHQQPGHLEAEWNGTDMNGNVTASGIYFYTMTVQNNHILLRETKKMLYLR